MAVSEFVTINQLTRRRTGPVQHRSDAATTETLFSRLWQSPSVFDSRERVWIGRWLWSCYRHLCALTASHVELTPAAQSFPQYVCIKSRSTCARTSDSLLYQAKSDLDCRPHARQSFGADHHICLMCFKTKAAIPWLPIDNLDAQ